MPRESRCDFGLALRSIKKSGLAEARPPVTTKSSTLRSVANPPAPVWIANTMHTASSAGAGCYHDRRGHYHARRRYNSRSSIVHAAVVTVAAAAAVGATMKAGPAATGDWNCQAGLRLLKRCERHGLGDANAKDADSECRCERKRFIQSFLLWFVGYILRPRRA